MTQVITLGWRERLSLPSLGVPMLKAKLDTGARSCSLHVDELVVSDRQGATWLSFLVCPGRPQQHPLRCEAPAVDRRVVTDTGGRRSERWFIRSEIELAGCRFSADISLSDRQHMLFPMLLGRTALQGRFQVDPAQSYVDRRLYPPRPQVLARRHG